jgi:hypothetical protein
VSADNPADAACPPSRNVENMPHSPAAYVNRDASGLIQSVLLTQSTAGTTRHAFQDDTVLVWPAMLRISLLPDPGLQHCMRGMRATACIGKRGGVIVKRARRGEP